MSHVQYRMKSIKHQINVSQPITYNPHPNECYSFSGCYLRGGGLTYKIFNNWGKNVEFFDGSTEKPKVIQTRPQSNCQWSVAPIDWSQREIPKKQEGVTRHYSDKVEAQL